MRVTLPYRLAAVVLVCLPLGGAAAPRADWTPAPPAKARTGLALPVGKCLNYAGQLEVERDEAWMRPETMADFGEMHEAGFRTVRMPLNFARFTGKGAPYKLDKAYLRRVERTVRAATDAKLNVILDYHLDTQLFADPKKETARYIATWRQVADHFRDAPPSVWFELLNEAHPPITNAMLPSLFRPALKAIRVHNPTRPVIIGGEWFNSLESLDTLDMLDDPNIAPTFHYYLPLPFSHQGATWTTPFYPRGATYGSDADLAQLKEFVEKTRAYMARTGRVPFIGEYGAVESIPVPQRARYYGDVTRAFASIGVQSCVWGYVNNFPIRTRNGWIAPLVDSIATTE